MWVQDYHLMLLPALLKQRYPRMKVMPHQRTPLSVSVHRDASRTQLLWNPGHVLPLDRRDMPPSWQCMSPGAAAVGSTGAAASHGASLLPSILLAMSDALGALWVG